MRCGTPPAVFFENREETMEVPVFGVRCFGSDLRAGRIGRSYE